MNEPQDLISFIKSATSPFHVIKESQQFLTAQGFQSLPFDTPWSLEKGGRYYTTVYDTTLFAFTIGKDISETPTFRVASSHTDFPCLRIKPKAELSEKNYLKLNIEVYGGVTKCTWLDRPLSIAGKVALKSNDIFHPETVLIDWKRPLLTIPNLAIHMNPELNKGVELNGQIDMIPLFATLDETLNKDSFFIDFLANELGKAKEEILDFDLYVYVAEEGCTLGMKDEFISSPRLDNLTSVFACLYGISSPFGSVGISSPTNFSEIPNPSQINVIALFDNEEVGSRTKQGADSIVSNLLLEKIYEGLGLSRTDVYNSILKSHMISIDVAHGLHPNHPGKNDPTNVTQLNQGVTLKMSFNQRYATDTEAIGAIQQLCQAYDIPCQKFVNRSDMAGGTTLGSLSSSWLPMKTVDLGVPILAMHSARELMGTKDQKALNNLVKYFFCA